MPVSKPEDTQALSAAEIKAEGLRPRQRNTNNQQSVAVQVAAIVMIGAVALAFITGIVVTILALTGKL